ncbi:hypothetical protein C8F04DRAFT_1179515 [Mycena alexandri]|uniref:Uncharacterized protein n=1 Tax=Mycena alexandri TaxID=1745969 RepID=A0AAD6X861_9AGAR|nr:hypothetical protein C8F04DRAFT_1179515 [Mycena alexandri]
MPPLPVEHWSPTVSLRFEAAANNKDIKPRLFEMVDVDPFRAYIDEPQSYIEDSSWTCRPLEDRVTLSFANLNALRAFLEALSHVRVTDRVSHGILHEERHWTPHDVQAFSDLRVRRYLQEPIGRLPIEILSEIFILLPLARNQHRARSPAVTLSLEFEVFSYHASEELRIARFHPPPFAGVHSLKLSSPQSQLAPFLGGARSIFHSLQSLSLELPHFELHQRNSLPSLCCSAPLLQTLIIESSFVVVGRTDNTLLTAFPWSRLTTCVLLQRGKFILRRDHYDYPRTPSPSVRFQPWLFDRSPTVGLLSTSFLLILALMTQTHRAQL